MKKILLLIGLLAIGYISFSFITKENQNPQIEYKVITSVESIVPNGLGRSRLISSNEERNFEDYTSERSKEDDKRNKSKRSAIRIKDFEETKLLNFYNIGGIRFQNIVSNDVVITSKLIAMGEDGWDLAFVSSSSESDAGKGDGQGIFVTRYIFKRVK
jgi:type III secretory pathway component EscR